MAVMLPVGENENEWIAYHLVDFFKQITMLYGSQFTDSTSLTVIMLQALSYRIALKKVALQ